MEKNKFTHGSLFSGIGGPEIAAEEMGWKNMFHCEINPFGRKILDYWFPNSKSYEDITKTNFTEWRGKINVLTGGFPCQPFSCAGQRKGAEDDRYLWPEMLRAIREIQPDWVVGENVAGILSMVQPGSETALGREESLFGEVDRKRILHRQEYVVETVCNDLEREGYFVQPVVIPACAVGAPHRRDRIWFVAHADGEGLQPEGTELSPEGASGNHPRDATAHPDSGGDTPLATGGTLETSGAHIHAREGGRGEEPQRPDGLPGLPRATPDADGKGLEGRTDLGTLREEGEKNASGQPSRFLCPGGEEFPTQSPVCSRDDGISTRLDGIAFSKWRQESIKAYGNAIVPQVMYEIFQAIQETYNQ